MGNDAETKNRHGDVGDSRRMQWHAGKIGTPAMTIIGEWSNLRQTLNWFEHRPLFGQTIVVTRTRQQASELSQQLEDLGATVIEAPTIEIVSAGELGSAVDAALAEAPKFRLDHLHQRQWRAGGARSTAGRWAKMFARLGMRKLAAIGPRNGGGNRARSLPESRSMSGSVCRRGFGGRLIAGGYVAGKRFLLSACRHCAADFRGTCSFPPVPPRFPMLRSMKPRRPAANCRRKDWSEGSRMAKSIGSHSPAAAR